MPIDTTQQPPAGDATKPAPYIWCSDCRAPMRAHYWALDTRPVCAKCRPQYAGRIAQGSGPGAFRRALAYGMGAALAGALVIALLVATIHAGRILVAIGIGWMVGKAINKATGDWYDRRYQIMAAVLTYFAVGLGSLLPVIVELARLPDRPAAVARPSKEGREAATYDDPGDVPIEGADTATYDVFADPDAQPADLADEFERRQAESRAQRAKSFERDRAEKLQAAGWLVAIPKLVLLLLGLPLLSLFAFGIYGAVVGLMALGYGVYKAWDITSDGVSYRLSGPFRVGTGPIPAAF